MALHRARVIWCGTAAEWAAANPLLQHGVLGIAYDTGEIKHGNGIDRWTMLDAIPIGGQRAVLSHADRKPLPEAGTRWKVPDISSITAQEE